MLPFITLPVACVLVATLACCSAEKSKAPPPASQVEHPYDSVAIDPATGVAALAGTWTGHAVIKGYGAASGMVTLDDTGVGRFVGSRAGMPQRGSLRVNYWDGQWLEAEAEGYRERIRASLRGKKLHLELPYVGTVVLHRSRP